MTNGDVSALIRGTIFVRDLKRSSAFYQALGLNEVYYEGTLEDRSACEILGFATAGPVAICILKRSGPNYGMIGLFQLDTALGAAEVDAPTGPARIGEVALVFYVREMSATLTALRLAGATWSPEPQLFRMEHRAQREVCLRDCDGVLLNLVEADPDEQNRTRAELDYAAP